MFSLRNIKKYIYILQIERDDKYDFPYFSIKAYVVTPHQNCLIETVLMRGHNMCFH